MLENLQMARPGQMDEGDDDMMSALDDLGDMIRKQQQLRDKTFKQGQDMRRDRQRGQQGQQPLGRSAEGSAGACATGSTSCSSRCASAGSATAARAKGKKANRARRPRQSGGQARRAGKAMGEAEGELGEGDAESAVDSQGRALEAMRKGAQGLAQQMQQQGMGPGPKAGPAARPAARAQETDPLGRPLRGREYGDDVTVKVPGEIDAQRARRILEELRKRYGESYRPQLELDYIERLLKGY